MQKELLRDVVDYDSKILCEPVPCYSFDTNSIDDNVKLAKILQYNITAYGGLGLAAPQIGISARVFGIVSNPFLTFFNPVIVSFSKTKSVMEEVSINYPGLVVKVKRPNSIRLRYQQPNGVKLTKKFTGMTARIIQHHMHFLDGEDFFVDANRYHFEKAMKKWRKNKP